MHKKCNYGNIVPKKSKLIVTGGLKKIANSYNFAIFSSTFHLMEVNLALWTSQWVSLSAFESCLLARGLRCTTNWCGLTGGACLREVLLSRDSTAILFFNRNLLKIMRENYVTFIIYCGFLNFVLDHHLILFSSIIT